MKEFLNLETFRSAAKTQYTSPKRLVTVLTHSCTSKSSLITVLQNVVYLRTISFRQTFSLIMLSWTNGQNIFSSYIVCLIAVFDSFSVFRLICAPYIFDVSEPIIVRDHLFIGNFGYFLMLKGSKTHNTKAHPTTVLGT